MYTLCVASNNGTITHQFVVWNRWQHTAFCVGQMAAHSLLCWSGGSTQFVVWDRWQHTVSCVGQVAAQSLLCGIDGSTLLAVF